MAINIWAFDKDISIKHLLLVLEDRFSGITDHIIDDADLDPRAIRLENPNAPEYSIYIFTYGQEQDCYGVHIEYQNTGKPDRMDTIEAFEHLGLERLIELLTLHLD